MILTENDKIKSKTVGLKGGNIGKQIVSEKSKLPQSVLILL